MSLAKKKKKVDYGALASPFMRIPKMEVRVARALLDLGIKEIYELKGRDPESIYMDLSKIRVAPLKELKIGFALAVEFAQENC